MARRPDFIGLGGGRSGTNWLATCLFEHPRLCVPTGEVHFFSRERNWSKGQEWYESLFKNCSPDKKVGELSSSYLADPNTAERIAALYPQAKLIVSLRNPVERTLSNYLNELNAGNISPDLSFQEALKRFPDLTNGSLHATNLGRYLKIFPSDQLLILIFEETFADPVKTLRGIFQFLGVDADFLPSSVYKKINPRVAPRLKILHRFFSKGSGFLRQPSLTPLWWAIKKTGITDFIKRLNEQKPEIVKPRFSEEDRGVLEKVFAEEIKQTEKILGRSILQWRQ